FWSNHLEFHHCCCLFLPLHILHYLNGIEPNQKLNIKLVKLKKHIIIYYQEQQLSLLSKWLYIYNTLSRWFANSSKINLKILKNKPTSWVLCILSQGLQGQGHIGDQEQQFHSILTSSIKVAIYTQYLKQMVCKLLENKFKSKPLAAWVLCI